MTNQGNGRTQGHSLTPMDAWALAFCCMVGWGVYVCTKEAFGRDHAFLSGWFLCLSYLTIVFLNGTTLFIIVRTVFSDVTQTGMHYSVAGNAIHLGETFVSVLALARLGLANTKRIIDLMGGTIEVLTAPGSGTQLIIRLKLKPAQQKDIPDDTRTPMHAAAESEVDFSGRRVLLVEDNPVNMRIAQRILTKAGFAVETAENGQVAVNRVSAAQPGHFDAILMDIQMPVMDGYAAARAIKALDNRALNAIPIVALTANAFPEDVEAAKAAGMVAHIAKPVDVQKLLATLRGVLSEHRR